MNRETLNPYRAHEKRIAFIEEFVNKGGLEKLPLTERDQNIALVYNLNEGATGEEIAEAFVNPPTNPVSKQRIQQISFRFLKTARDLASPELQAEHSEEELLVRKPRTLTQATLQVKEIAEGGSEVIERIRGIRPTPNLSQMRRHLRNRGVEVPPINFRIFADLKERIKEAGDDDEKLKRILQDVKDNSLKNYLQCHTKDPERVIASLSSILKKGGFSPSSWSVNVFAEKVTENGIPIRHVIIKYNHTYITYWIVFCKHQQRIIDALIDDPDLQKYRTNPAQLVRGTF